MASVVHGFPGVGWSSRPEGGSRSRADRLGRIAAHARYPASGDPRGSARAAARPDRWGESQLGTRITARSPVAPRRRLDDLIADSSGSSRVWIPCSTAASLDGDRPRKACELKRHTHEMPAPCRSPNQTTHQRVTIAWKPTATALLPRPAPRAARSLAAPPQMTATGLVSAPQANAGTIAWRIRFADDRGVRAGVHRRTATARPSTRDAAR